jgi:hypothetical protein
MRQCDHAITAHGGAERYWRHTRTRTRVVRCRNGVMLIHRRGRWRVVSLNLATIKDDPEWQETTSTGRPAPTKAG